MAFKSAGNKVFYIFHEKTHCTLKFFCLYSFPQSTLNSRIGLGYKSKFNCKLLMENELQSNQATGMPNVTYSSDEIHKDLLLPFDANY